jgi:hypothetical protein
MIQLDKRSRYSLSVAVPEGTGDYGTAWRTRAQGVQGADAERMASALERNGESIMVFRDRPGGLGLLAYATGQDRQEPCALCHKPHRRNATGICEECRAEVGQ